MIKISKLADYAVVILGAMGRVPDTHMNAVTLSSQTGLPEPTVAKVLKLLTKAGVVQSTRGIYGGYRVACDPNSLSVAQIIEAVDGPITITQCADGMDHSCGHFGTCAMKGRWRGVNDAIKVALGEVMLGDMIGHDKPGTATFEEKVAVPGRAEMKVLA